MASVSFVLPGYPRFPIGGYKVAYQYADYLAGHGHQVCVMHLRDHRLKPAPAWKRPLIAGLYRARRHTAPSWFTFVNDVEITSYPRMRSRHIPVSDYTIATSVGTADVVAERTRQTGQVGVYLIQHLEDFTVSREEVIRTWRLPLRKIVVSRWLQHLAEEHRLEATLVENGIDPSVFFPGPLPSARETSVLAMVSEQQWKRTDLVIDLMQRLRRSLPGVALRTFGTCPKPSGLPEDSEHVQLPTPKTLSALYRKSQVFVCASDFEGFGLPALEAMACRCAVISTRNGGVPAFAGGTATYVTPGDSIELHAAVEHALADTERLDRNANRALERAGAFTAEKAAARFMHALFSDAEKLS